MVSFSFLALALLPFTPVVYSAPVAATNPELVARSQCFNSTESDVIVNNLLNTVNNITADVDDAISGIFKLVGDIPDLISSQGGLDAVTAASGGFEDLVDILGEILNIIGQVENIVSEITPDCIVQDVVSLLSSALGPLLADIGKLALGGVVFLESTVADTLSSDLKGVITEIGNITDAVIGVVNTLTAGIPGLGSILTPIEAGVEGLEKLIAGAIEAF